jgi:hypothetical protein
MTSRNEVSEILGEIDPLIIERVVDTGASIDEIAEALGVLEDEAGFGDAHRIPSSSRVIEVRSILAELLADEQDTDEEYRVITERGDVLADPRLQRAPGLPVNLGPRRRSARPDRCARGSYSANHQRAAPASIPPSIPSQRYREHRCTGAAFRSPPIVSTRVLNLGSGDLA